MRRLLILAALCAALLAAPSYVSVDAQQPATAAARVAIDPDDIGGVVRSANGPEAGVWVIAETTHASCVPAWRHHTPTSIPRPSARLDDPAAQLCRCRDHPIVVRDERSQLMTKLLCRGEVRYVATVSARSGADV